MAWNSEWTIEMVKKNYEVLGCIEPEDLFQLIQDAKELKRLYDGLGRRCMYDLHQCIDESE